MKILAIMPVYNEDDILRWIIEKLVAQRIDVLVLDNHSTDSSHDAAVNAGARVEMFGREFDFDDAELTDEVMTRSCVSDADWIIVHSADEVFRSPALDESYRAFIERADAAGANVIDHNTRLYVPTDNVFKYGDPEEFFRYWVSENAEGFGTHTQERTFKPHASLRSETFLHSVIRDDKTVFAERGLRKHYTVRSGNHAIRKHHERKTRFRDSGEYFYRRREPMAIWSLHNKELQYDSPEEP